MPINVNVAIDDSPPNGLSVSIAAIRTDPEDGWQRVEASGDLSIDAARLLWSRLGAALKEFDERTPHD